MLYAERKAIKDIKADDRKCSRNYVIMKLDKCVSLERSYCPDFKYTGFGLRQSLPQCLVWQKIYVIFSSPRVGVTVESV